MSERAQTVVFMRHAVARHNIRDPQTGRPPDLHNPALLDPPLVSQGKTSALEAGERIRTWWHMTQPGEPIEMVITSPLTRCIQTSVLAFLPGEHYNHHVPFVCREEVREAFGAHYPDQRRQKSLLMVRLKRESQPWLYHACKRHSTHTIFHHMPYFCRDTGP